MAAPVGVGHGDMGTPGTWGTEGTGGTRLGRGRSYGDMGQHKGHGGREVMGRHGGHWGHGVMGVTGDTKDKGRRDWGGLRVMGTWRARALRGDASGGDTGWGHGETW